MRCGVCGEWVCVGIIYSIYVCVVVVRGCTPLGPPNFRHGPCSSQAHGSRARSTCPSRRRRPRHSRDRRASTSKATGAPTAELPPAAACSSTRILLSCETVMAPTLPPHDRTHAPPLTLPCVCFAGQVVCRGRALPLGTQATYRQWQCGVREPASGCCLALPVARPTSQRHPSTYHSRARLLPGAGAAPAPGYAAPPSLQQPAARSPHMRCLRLRGARGASERRCTSRPVPRRRAASFCRTPVRPLPENAPAAAPRLPLCSSPQQPRFAASQHSPGRDSPPTFHLTPRPPPRGNVPHRRAICRRSDRRRSCRHPHPRRLRSCLHMVHVAPGSRSPFWSQN